MGTDDSRFCVFILSHGRPGNVITLRSLRRHRYTGPWYIVLDNEDPTRGEYIRKFGADRVVVFDKPAIAETFDPGDLSVDRRTVVYARNACWDIARSLGYSRFLQLDDDYIHFNHRYGEGDLLRTVMVNSADRLFRAMFGFLDATGAASVALCQGGDLIGGLVSFQKKPKISRKAMNTFFCRSDDAWRFMGRINEDVNAYTSLTHRGVLFLTTLEAGAYQNPTQRLEGGMTGAYRDAGTYVKSFYSVMMCPSAVSIGVLRDDYERIHHRVQWNNCSPMILPEETRRSPRGPEVPRLLEMRRGS